MSPAFDFEGRAIAYRPGQTVAAALVAAGVRSWRSTARSGRPAGLFCGIGVCFECLICVDEVPDVRACLALADEAHQVRGQHGLPVREAPPVPPAASGPSGSPTSSSHCLLPSDEGGAP